MYEGWHKNGQKMVEYDYINRTFIEWDEWGIVLERGYDHTILQNHPLAENSHKRLKYFIISLYGTIVWTALFFV